MRKLASILLFFALTTASFACDPSFPKGIHGHKLAVSYYVKLNERATSNAAPANYMQAKFEQLAKGTDISFQKVENDADANLVFHVNQTFNSGANTFETRLEVYGLGKAVRLFAVKKTLAVNSQDEDAVIEAAVKTLTDAVTEAYSNIKNGWGCPTKDPAVQTPRRSAPPVKDRQ